MIITILFTAALFSNEDSILVDSLHAVCDVASCHGMLCTALVKSDTMDCA